MAASNPAFRNTPFGAQATRGAQVPDLSSAQLDELYGRPAAGPTDTDRMSYDDVIVKTAITFAFVLAGATIGFFMPALYLPFMFVGLALALVNIFKKQPSAPLVLAYGAAEGVFLGGLSRVVENNFPGIIFQALLGTAAVFVVTLALFASGKVRASKKATKVFMIAMIGYLVFSLINVGLMIFNVPIAGGAFGLLSNKVFGIPLGLIIGVLVVIMAAYSLVLDFDNVQQGVRNGAPRQFAWLGAFGIMVTVVWLYVEILRILAIARGSN